jgi:excisionase family DNA binding protein
VVDGLDRGGKLMTQDEPMLTMAQAAERLHLSYRSVADLVKQGKIACRRLGPRGGKILLPASSVEAYWDSTLKVGNQRPRAKLRHFKV